MGAADEVHVVLLQEPRDDVGAKGERDTSVVFAPARDVLVRIGPQQVAEQTAVGDLPVLEKVHHPATLSSSCLQKLNGKLVKDGAYISRPHHAPNLLHRVKVGAQTAVHGENLLVNDCRNWQAIEAVSEGLPKLDVVPPLALIVEAVDSVDGSALVVPAEDEKVLRVLDLVCKEQANGLERLLATVHVVAEEQVVGFGRESAILEQTQEVVVLSVDIAANLGQCQSHLHGPKGPRERPWHRRDTYLDWSLKLQEDGLRDENLTGLGAQIANLRLEELDLLARPASSHLQKSVYDGVQIHLLFRHGGGLPMAAAWMRKGRRGEVAELAPS